MSPREAAEVRARQDEVGDAPGEALALQTEVARRLERAQALRAPVAPPEAELAANQTGWLLANGPVERSPAPRQWWPKLSTGVAAFMGVAIGALDGLALELTALAMLAVLTVGVFYGTGWLGRRRLRRLCSTPPARASDPLLQQPAGEAARVSGVISAGPTFPSLFRAQPSVLARSKVGSADEMRGIDFTVILDDGARVLIAARGGYLLDTPAALDRPPACGPVYSERPQGKEHFGRIASGLHWDAPWRSRLPRRLRETSVGPGDRVEVMGVLEREVSPDGVAGGGRSMPMRLTLRSSDRIPLCVRKLRD
jgi:hypothetical protein